jgi:hypothetical protein
MQKLIQTSKLMAWFHLHWCAEHCLRHGIGQGWKPGLATAAVMQCRADSIVRDAEVVRHALVPKDTLGGRWTILGQSFGGFCCLTYLSIAPQGESSGGS